MQICRLGRAHLARQRFHGEPRIVFCDADQLVGIVDAEMSFDVIGKPGQLQEADRMRAALSLVGMAVEPAMQQHVAGLYLHEARKARLGERAGQHDGGVAMMVTVTGQHRVSGEFVYAWTRGPGVDVLRQHPRILSWRSKEYECLRRGTARGSSHSPLGFVIMASP